MKSSDQIKAIRAQLNLSQSELAKRLGVSFATVNRWEKERCEPSQIAVHAIKNLCTENNIDFSRLEGTAVITLTKSSRFITDPSLDCKDPLRPSAEIDVTLAEAFTWGQSGCSRSH